MVTGHQTPPFFKRGLPLPARATIFLSISLSLLVADLRLNYLETLRQALTVLSYPLQIAAATPAEFVSNTATYFSGLASLKRENQRLQAQQLAMAEKLLFAEQLQQENATLRGLLKVNRAIGLRTIAAEIVFSARDPFSRKVILDKGSLQDIEPGSPVVDPQGLIGQVTRVFPLHAEVTLLSDKEQAIPVIVERSGLRAVMFGSGNGLLELKFLAANAEVKPGDRILTSGLDGLFAPGLPVATVLKVTRDSAESFARILCKPIASVERSGAVLVLSRTDPAPQRPADDRDEASRRASAGRIRNRVSQAFPEPVAADSAPAASASAPQAATMAPQAAASAPTPAPLASAPAASAPVAVQSTPRAAASNPAPKGD
ncbi:rod shape-determining protein MreC [Uliginosibacterium sp. TH139]|uniref:rod shape-determining protein MreC n=1 Tax=Uliginosibacterium sp. TH139 TaxID=2067453 RepID=UPI000C7A1860|nr:rod shape-determining protein MreC [Uliginosibacterium sp. TH139]